MASSQKEGRSGTQEHKTNIHNNWKYPKVPINQIYHKKPFSLFPNYSIKDFEQTLTYSSSADPDANLLLHDQCKKHAKKYKFLHLGLVQIAIKPLIRDGLKAPILVCLRDNRHSNFNNSLLAVVETDLCNGPIYFECSPNFLVPWEEGYGLNVLTMKVMSGGIPLAMTYRVVVKAMCGINPEAKIGFSQGETIYVQENVTKVTKWDTIQAPESWTQPPKENQRRRFRFEGNSLVLRP